MRLRGLLNLVHLAIYVPPQQASIYLLCTYCMEGMGGRGGTYPNNGSIIDRDIELVILAILYAMHADQRLVSSRLVLSCVDAMSCHQSMSALSIHH